MSRGLLLDTCTLLWLASDQTQLSARARDAIAADSDLLHVSAISAFEIGVKHARRRIELPLDPWTWFRRAVAQHGVRVVPITARIAAMSALLPPLHNDPCDRMIVATALLRRMRVLTPDTLIVEYRGVRVIW